MLKQINNNNYQRCPGEAMRLLRRKWPRFILSPCGQGTIDIDDLVHVDLSDMTTADFEEAPMFIRIHTHQSLKSFLNASMLAQWRTEMYCHMTFIWRFAVEEYCGISFGGLALLAVHAAAHVILHRIESVMQEELQAVGFVTNLEDPEKLEFKEYFCELIAFLARAALERLDVVEEDDDDQGREV